MRLWGTLCCGARVRGVRYVGSILLFVGVGAARIFSWPCRLLGWGWALFGGEVGNDGVELAEEF